MKIETLTGNSKQISAEPHTLGLNERLTLAAKRAAMFFAAAVVSVFIPVMHFFLVPLFLLLSLFFGVKNFRFEKSVDLTGVACPACEKDLGEKKMFYRDDEVRLYCYQCQTQLKVS